MKIEIVLRTLRANYRLNRQDLKMFKQMVEQILDTEGIKRGEYFIKASFDSTLEEYKEAMDEVNENINEEFREAGEDLNLDCGTTLKLDSVPHLGHHFRITLQNEKNLRDKKNYTTLDAVKGGVRFTTEKLKALNLDFSEARKSYEEQQKSIVDEAIRVARKILT